MTNKRNQYTIDSNHKTSRQSLRENSLSQLGELSFSLLHELLQPLLCIQNHLSSSLKEENSEQIKPHLLLMQKEVGRLSLLGQRTFEIYKGGSLPCETVSASEAIQHVVQLFSPIFSLEDIRVTVIHDLANNSIKVHSMQTVQILINLLSNAVRAVKKLPTKDKQIRISFQTNSEATFAFKVWNNGPRMTEQEALELSNLRQNGLGLKISSALAKQSGGHITFISEPDFGTEFCFWLPKTIEKDSADTRALAA